MKDKRFFFLVPVLILAMMALACSFGDIFGGDDEAEPAEAPAVSERIEEEEGEAEETSAAETSEEAQPAEEEEEEAPGSAGIAGEFANPEEVLDSYRMRMTYETQGEGGLLSAFMSDSEVEWTREPNARHTTTYGEAGEIMMETIQIEDETWMDMGTGWMKTAGDAGAAGFDTSAMETSMEDLLSDMVGGLDADGSENINGTHCKRYQVDTDFSMDMPVPEDISPEAAAFMPQSIEGHVEGTIWVADGSGLPPVIIRSETTQEITLVYADREEVMVYDELRELYDINEPITIEAPDDAMEMPSPPEGGDMPGVGGTEGGVSVETAPLDLLDSYRLEMTNIMTMTDGMEMVTGLIQEYVREPEALHVAMTLSGAPFGEFIQIGDQFWTLVNGQWIASTEEEMSSAMETGGDAMEPDSDMLPIGEKVINGVHCLGYTSEVAMGDTLIRKTIWVADEAGIPPIVIRGVGVMQTPTMSTYNAIDITNINEPIDIQPPQ